MTFEVGKKYRRDGSTAIHTVIHVHKVAGGVWAMMNSDREYIPTVRQWNSSWEEYKEPRTLTRWINVYKKRDDSQFVLGTDRASRVECLTNISENMELLDTIEIKWVEK